MAQLPIIRLKYSQEKIEMPIEGVSVYHGKFREAQLGILVSEFVVWLESESLRQRKVFVRVFRAIQRYDSEGIFNSLDHEGETLSTSFTSEVPIDVIIHEALKVREARSLKYDVYLEDYNAFKPHELKEKPETMDIPSLED